MQNKLTQCAEDKHDQCVVYILGCHGDKRGVVINAIEQCRVTASQRSWKHNSADGKCAKSTRAVFSQALGDCIMIFANNTRTFFLDMGKIVWDTR